MKKVQLKASQSYYLYKRTLIETVFDQLVNICQIEHTRHRSPINFLANLWAGIIAYTFQEKKPTIRAFERKNIQHQKIVLSQDENQ